MLKKILVLLAVIVAGFFAFAAAQPTLYRVQRSAKIEAPAPVVFAQLSDFRAWAAWSTWEGKDPAMRKTYEGTPGTVGATYAWQGNEQVGEGKMTITGVQAPMELKLRLEFIKPFAAVASTQFIVAPEPGGGVTATWSMDGTNNLIAKAFGLFVNMDKMVGGDFEKGFAKLKQVAEAEAQKQAAEAAAAAKAKADAEAAAAAKAKADAEAAAALAVAEEEEKEKDKGKKSKGKKH
jgi:hypothetical protein